MLNYLTSDEVIREPFLIDEILPRFVSTLLNILSRLVGARSLELKVDNMEAYNFQPKHLLREVCLTMLNFSSPEIAFDKFCSSVSYDGFCEEGAPLLKAVNTISKLGLVSVGECDKLAGLAARVIQMCTLNKDVDALIADAPDGKHHVNILLLIL
jgi:ubiquitin conjugation factor E4 B